MDTRPVVRTIGLTKTFKDFWRRDKVVAVKDLDLEVHPGEIFGLLGPNGSGKSTTIKMLLGLLHPTRGRISIFGHPPTDVATKSRIGYLPEESYLYRFLNARETLDLYSKLFRQAKAVRHGRVDKLLEMVGLQHQAKRRIGEYSKGMARRIGLAQALINDPDFLILDEPTTGMDPIGTQQIKELIRELGRRGKTILLSSHLLADVQDVCDRVCILYGGQQQALGPLNELLTQDDVTQITTSRLRGETVDEIKKLLKRLENREDLKVERPTERLEHFFVRIVKEAQASRIATSGVQAGGALPDFLSGIEAGEQLIESLVTAAEKQEEEEEKTPARATTTSGVQPEQVILEDLIEHSEPEPAAAAAPLEPQPRQDQSSESTGRRRDENVDDDLIDSLLKGEERSDG